VTTGVRGTQHSRVGRYSGALERHECTLTRDESEACTGLGVALSSVLDTVREHGRVIAFEPRLLIGICMVLWGLSF